MNEPSKPTTQKVSLEDSRLTADETADIKWLEEQCGVVWDSHVVEFVRYDLRRKEFQTCTILAGRGFDMEEIKYRSLDSLGDFEDDRKLKTLTIDGELQDDLGSARKLFEHPPSELTDEEWAEIYGDYDGVDRGLDWS